jgi:hypothetical protein
MLLNQCFCLQQLNWVTHPITIRIISKIVLKNALKVKCFICFPFSCSDIFCELWAVLQECPLVICSLVRYDSDKYFKVMANFLMASRCEGYAQDNTKL